MNGAVIAPDPEAPWQTQEGEEAWVAAIHDAHRLEDSSDASLAHWLSFRVEGHLLFDHAEGAWFGLQRDQTWRKLGPEFELRTLQEVARTALKNMRDSDADPRAKHLVAMASNRKAQAVAKALSVHDYMSAKPDQWDRSPWLLGTTNAVVDLRTGEPVEDYADSYIRRRTTVPWVRWQRADRSDGLPANAPRRFIEATQRILPDPDVWRYVMRALGYALTGVASEQVWFFLHGRGANGKTFLVELLKLILGDAETGGYVYEGKAETFTVSKAYNALNFGSAMNAMRGARVVIVPEVSHGELNTDLLKRLSGGDGVTYRAPYARQDVTYTPTAKVFMHANARPTITDSSHGQWRRLLEIPFNVTIPEAERVKDFHRVLYEAEGAAIQRFLIDAAAQYATGGPDRSQVESILGRGTAGPDLLPVPEAVRAATADYQATSDPFSLWLADRAVLDKREEAKASSLFSSYDWWCDDHRERAMGLKGFTARLLQLAGVEKRERKDGNYYLGIGLAER